MPLPTTITPPTSPLQRVADPAYVQRGVELWVKRDDLLHPVVSGNKWRKLKYNVAEAEAQGARRWLTFGGAHSNHLPAVAASAQAQGRATIGVVRGEEPKALSPTLHTCQALGMQLHIVSRTEYRQRGEKDYQQTLMHQFQADYLIPEGGSSALALPGVAELWQEVDAEFDWAVTAVGTGGTLAGLALGAPEHTQVLGVVALKGYAGQMEREVEALLAQQNARTHGWRLVHDAHHGGYAKATPALIEFMTHWPQQHGFLLDPIYTGKVFYYLHHRIVAGYFPRGTRILALHTGGLQGIAAFNTRYGCQLPTP